MKYKIYTDGGARGNPGLSACAFVVKDELDNIIYSEGIFLDIATNNQAEYKGILKGLEFLIKKNIKDVDVYMDSELVVKQLKGEYKVKDPTLKLLKATIDELIKQFEKITFNHVLRELNKDADKLVNKVLDENS